MLQPEELVDGAALARAFIKQAMKAAFDGCVHHLGGARHGRVIHLVQDEHRAAAGSPVARADTRDRSRKANSSSERPQTMQKEA